MADKYLTRSQKTKNAPLLDDIWSPAISVFLFRSTLCGRAIVGCLVAPSSWQAFGQRIDVLVARARALLAEGRPQAPFAALEPLERERAGDQAHNYLLGIAALDAGTAHFTFALKRAVLLRPDDKLALAVPERAGPGPGRDRVQTLTSGRHPHDRR